MSIQVAPIKREFVFEKQSGVKIPLSEVNSKMTPEQVMEHYASFYPELTTGVVEGPTIKDGGIAQFRFSSRLGTKG